MRPAYLRPEGDVMRMRLMTGRHDEAEIIGRAITETLVAELDRLIASGRV